MEPAILTLLRFDAEVIAAVFAPVVVLVVAALVSKDAAFRRASLRWFVPLTLVWFAPCWLTGRSPAAFDLLEGTLRPWKGAAPYAMEGNGLLADVPLQFVPWREVATEAWREGELPALNRHAGAGSPLWANPQAAVLAPATLLGVTFSSFAWPLFAATLRLLTALAGTYLFVRREGAGEPAAVSAAVAWGFGAALTAFALFPHANVMSILPWMLLAIGRVVARDGAGGVAAASAVLALMFLGGHPESVLHCAFVALPFAAREIARLPRDRMRSAVARCAAFGMLGAMLAAPALVPFAMQLPLSERVARLQVETKLAAAPALTLENLTPFVLPAHYFHSMDAAWDGDNFNEAAAQYAGLATLALAFAGAVAAWRRSRFWVAVAAACALLAFEWTGTALLAKLVPGFGHVLHGRLRFVLAFAVAVAAAHGIDALAGRARNAHRSMLIATAVAIVLVTVAVVRYRSLYADHGTLSRVAVAAAVAVAVAVAVAIAAPRGGRAALAIPALIFCELAASLALYNAPVAREHYYPDRPSLRALAGGGTASRALALGGGLMPNCGAMYRLEQAGVNDPMAFEPFVALLRSAGYDTRFYFNRFHAVPPKVLLDYLGISRIYLGPGARVEGLPVVYRGADGTVVANSGALPRYFVPARVAAAADTLDAFKGGGDARTVHAAIANDVVPAPASVTLASYGASKATLRVDARGPTFVASSEVAMPGWELERDGAPWPTVRINGIFLGWPAPAGSSTFVLRYRPPGLRVGIALACAALAVLCVWSFSRRAARRPA